MGYSIVNEDVERIVTDLCDHLNDPVTRAFVFLNPHSIVLAERNAALRQAIRSASTVLCDGVGLALAGRILNREAIQRVYGYKFFGSLSHELSRRASGARIFFLGGRQDSIADLESRYCTEFPHLVVSSYAPPFKAEFSDADVADMAQRIADFRADVVWVGLGSPKQELLLPRLIAHVRIPCVAAVGAVFDFYMGRIPHAPAWVRRMGLQWAHRMLLEPRRLWRRTLISGPLFLGQVLRELATARRRMSSAS